MIMDSLAVVAVWPQPKVTCWQVIIRKSPIRWMGDYTADADHLEILRFGINVREPPRVTPRARDGQYDAKEKAASR